MVAGRAERDSMASPPAACGGDKEDGSDRGGGDGHGKILADSHGTCGWMWQAGYGACDGTVAAVGKARRVRWQR